MHFVLSVAHRLISSSLHSSIRLFQQLSLFFSFTSTHARLLVRGRIGAFLLSFVCLPIFRSKIILPSDEKTKKKCCGKKRMNKKKLHYSSYALASGHSFPTERIRGIVFTKRIFRLAKHSQERYEVKTEIKCDDNNGCSSSTVHIAPEPT